MNTSDKIQEPRGGYFLLYEFSVDYSDVEVEGFDFFEVEESGKFLSEDVDLSSHHLHK